MDERPFIHASMHDFKTNISRYVAALEAGHYQGIILKRRKKPLGVFALFDPPPYAPERSEL